MNKHLMKKIDQMSPEALYMAIYQDCLTGVLNRTAFTEMGFSGAVALVDLDSLKYINDHHPDYHRAGDRMIQKLAEVLVLEFGENSVFRMGGDEFAVTGFSQDILTDKLVKLFEQYPFFSSGVGSTLAEADSDLIVDKMCNNTAQRRADRGEQPPWWHRVEGWLS